MELKLTYIKEAYLSYMVEWRNKSMESLRTPGFTTEQQQLKFHKKINNPDSRLKYFAIINEIEGLIGFTGLEIQFENRIAEISLIINPDLHRKGFGNESVKLILFHAFNILNLNYVVGECYYCNPSIDFWRTTIEKYNADFTTLPKRKYWNNKYWDSLYFVIEKDKFNNYGDMESKMQKDFDSWVKIEKVSSDAEILAKLAEETRSVLNHLRKGYDVSDHKGIKGKD